MEAPLPLLSVCSLLESALGISAPWFIKDVAFDKEARRLTVEVDFRRGSRFAVAGQAGEHPVYDTQAKSYRHLNFFQFECYLQARVPRVKLPDGAIRLAEPPWAGQLSGLTQLFEALALVLCSQMTFTAVAETLKLSIHRVMALGERYVDLAEKQQDWSQVKEVAVDETAKQKGHDYVTLVADAQRHAVIFVTPGKDATTLERFAESLKKRGGDPAQIESVTIDMSAAYIKGVEEHLPNARITFDKFHVISHASKALDETRRQERKSDPELTGMRWKLLKNRENLTAQERAEVDAYLHRAPHRRTARAWLYREQLQEILGRKQPNVVRDLLQQWCTNVMRSKVEAMKKVAQMIRSHLEGIVAWSRSRQTNGFLEAINGLFQAAKRQARGYKRFSTIRTVIFLVAGKLDFTRVNPMIRELPTQN